jgi:hypothetical protein
MSNTISKEKELKIEELLNEGLSTIEISKQVHVAIDTVVRRAKKLGISLTYKRYKYSKLKDFPNDLKQLVIGSLLGDGCFCKAGNQVFHHSLVIVHSIEQLPYLQFKYSILNKHDLCSNYAIRHYQDDRFKNRNYTECKLRTRVCPVFTEMRNKCYLDGKKQINLDFIEDIDALGLAIWYMDDGYVTNNSCILSTCSFKKEDQEKLAGFLLGKFNLHFTTGKNDNSMYLKAEDFKKFKSLIEPYILDIFHYKLVPYNSRVLDKREELLETPEVDNQQPSTPLTKCEGSTTNS